MRRRVTCRDFPPLSGDIAATGGPAGIPASGHIPARASRTLIHRLRRNGFLPASDRLVRDRIAPEAKALDITRNIETINASGIRRRPAARSGRFAGYAGPSGRHAAEAVTKYVIVDMYAKAVQGMAPEDAVKWVHEQLMTICG